MAQSVNKSRAQYFVLGSASVYTDMCGGGTDHNGKGLSASVGRALCGEGRNYEGINMINRTQNNENRTEITNNRTKMR